MPVKAAQLGHDGLGKQRGDALLSGREKRLHLLVAGAWRLARAGGVAHADPHSRRWRHAAGSWRVCHALVLCRGRPRLGQITALVPVAAFTKAHPSPMVTVQITPGTGGVTRWRVMVCPGAFRVPRR